MRRVAAVGGATCGSIGGGSWSACRAPVLDRPRNRAVVIPIDEIRTMIGAPHGSDNPPREPVQSCAALIDPEAVDVRA
jgi:hypothetical protein